MRPLLLHIILTLAVFSIVGIGFCQSVLYQQDSLQKLKKITQSSGAIKKDLKEIGKKISFKKLFHHDDSTKLARQFIHEQHKLTKGRNGYPYKVIYDTLNSNEEVYPDSSLGKLKYEVFGWYPYWEKNLYESLNYSLLTTIAYFSYEVNPLDGHPKTIHDWKTTPLIDSAKANGNKILLTVTCFGKHKNKKFLKNDKAILTLIKNLQTLIKDRGADGVCLNFEGVSKEHKIEYSKFVVLLSQELKKQNKDYLVYLTVPAVDWAKSLDLEALVPAVDRFVIMGYGYYGSTSKVAGPVSLLKSDKKWEPFNLASSVDYYLKNNVPDSNLILALPYYGVIWDTKSGEKGSKVDGFVGNRTYDYITNKIKVPVQYDSISQNAWCSYVVACSSGRTQFRQCWFDNEATLEVKLNFIKKKKLRGMGIWALGYDKGSNDLWDVIVKSFSDTVPKEIEVKDGCDTVIVTKLDTVTKVETNTKTNTLTIIKKIKAIAAELSDLEGLLRKITNYKTALSLVLAFVSFFGTLGLAIAMFKPNTRVFFFGNKMYLFYYCFILLILLIIILKCTEVINDFSLVLIAGFVAGSIAIYLIERLVKRINKDIP